MSFSMLNSKPSDFQTKTVCGLSVLFHFQYARIIDCDTGRPPDCLVLAMTPPPSCTILLQARTAGGLGYVGTLT